MASVLICQEIQQPLVLEAIPQAALVLVYLLYSQFYAKMFVEIQFLSKARLQLDYREQTTNRITKRLLTHVQEAFKVSRYIATESNRTIW